ncbi:MAG: sigma-70 family RNA polymerase sigma factor [Chitinophagaceae bacterium]
MQQIPACQNRKYINGISEGDYKVFEAFYISYKVKAKNDIIKFLGDSHLAEDILQDLFLKVWAKRDKIITVEDFCSYLYMMTRNLVFDYFRKQKKYRLLKKKYTENFDSTSYLLQECIELKTRSKLFHDIITQLTDQQRKVYLLAGLDRFDIQEVAIFLNISPHTVRGHLQQARKAIRVILDKA